MILSVFCVGKGNPCRLLARELPTMAKSGRDRNCQHGYFRGGEQLFGFLLPHPEDLIEHGPLRLAAPVQKSLRPTFVPIEALEIVQSDGLRMPIHKAQVVASR